MFKTKDTNKYWSLLGKEGYGDHEYMMNLIGGKIDHPYKSNTEYVCIIDNMIKEIKEESKIDLNSEYNFNYVFKKDSSTTKTSVTDYNVIEDKIDKNGDKFTNYIFYGIMGEYNTEEDLKKNIIHYNNEVKGAYNNKKDISSSLCEMMYLNLIDFNYNPYTANGGRYRHDTDFTQANPPKDQKFLFTIHDIQNSYPVLYNNKFIWGNGKDYISFYAAKFFEVNSDIKFKNLTDKLESRGLPKITEDKRATIDNFIYMQKNGMPDKDMSNFKTAIGEINKGHKETHWMWFIFPQIKGLGSCDTSKFYEIKNVDSFVNLKSSKLLTINSSLHIKTTQTSSIQNGGVTKFIEVKSGYGNKIDSVVLTYKKFNKRFSYSISPNYENVDQLKLVKYNLILNLPPAENNPPDLKFKSSVELSELGEFGPETSIFRMFEKLKKAYSSLKCN